MERKCNNLNKTWTDLKQLAQSRVRWRVGVVDALCPGWDQGREEEEEEEKKAKKQNMWLVKLNLLKPKR